MKVVLDGVRYSFLNCYIPRVNKGQPEVDEKGNDKRKFSASVIFEDGGVSHKKVLSAIEQVAKEQWADKADGVLKTLFATDKVCLKDGAKRLNEEGEVLDGYDGMKFVNASSPASAAPVVFNRFGQKITAETRGMFTGDRRGPMSGDYGQVMLDIWAQDNQYGRRINATLKGIALSREGEPLGRREMSEDEIRSEFTFERPPSPLQE